MAALSASRNTPELADEGREILIGVEASTTVYLGSMVAVDGNGYAVPAQPYGASPLNALHVLGRAEYVYAGGILPPGINAQNVASAASLFPQVAGVGSAGALSVGVRRRGAFGFDNDGSITAANIGQLVFAVDDHTVGAADGAGATPVANTTSITIPASGLEMVVLHPYIVPGSFNAYSATGGGGTHYVEGTDYAVDYQAGIFVALAGGAISAGATVYVSYKYGQPTRPAAGQIVQVDSMVWVDFMRQANPSLTAANLAN